jgi:hypothetical protein
MKISPAVFSAVLIAISVATFGYSMHATSRMRALEQRLQRAEAAVESHSHALADTTTAARIRSLEDRVRQVESLAALHLSGASSATFGLEQRIQNVERKIEPRIETLPPYVPSR